MSTVEVTLNTDNLFRKEAPDGADADYVYRVDLRGPEHDSNQTVAYVAVEVSLHTPTTVCPTKYRREVPVTPAETFAARLVEEGTKAMVFANARQEELTGALEALEEAAPIWEDVDGL